MAESIFVVSLPAQVWDDVSQFQSAYQLGAGEAAAAFNLLTEVDPRVTDTLENMVQSLGNRASTCKQTFTTCGAQETCSK